MGDLPLRTPTDRRLGGPLPPQLANRTHAHPRASHLAAWGCPLVASSGVNPPFGGLSRSRGQVAYALLTRAPVVSGASSLLPLDLHVLGLSLAFILSQDQTLRCMNCFYFYILARCPYYSVCGIVGAHIPMRLPLPLHLCIFLLSRSISSKISLFVPLRPPPGGLFVSESGCKSTAFRVSHQTFSHLFLPLFHNALCFSEKNFRRFHTRHTSHHRLSRSASKVPT